MLQASLRGEDKAVCCADPNISRVVDIIVHGQAPWYQVLLCIWLHKMAWVSQPINTRTCRAYAGGTTESSVAGRC